MRSLLPGDPPPEVLTTSWLATAVSAPSGEPVWVTAFTGWGLLPLTRGHIKRRQNYQRQDGCRCDFATDITAVEGMGGSPVISSAGEVLGILTLAGKEKFHGLSFGVSFEEA